MDKQKTVFFAKNINELLYHLKTVQGLEIVGGCTGIDQLPDKSVSTFGIKELSQISLHERYIEIGAGTTMSDLINLGQKHIPQILYNALTTIATPNIRNMATIAGNIFAKDRKHTLYAPLLALDAKLEFKNSTESHTKPLSAFQGPQSIPQGFILTKITIPTKDYDISVFRRVGPENSINENSASFAFLASLEKNSLLSIRIAFAGPFVFKTSKDFENSLIGHRLPLSQKDIDEIEESITREFKKAAQDQMISDVVKQQFFNLIRYSFEQLT